MMGILPCLVHHTAPPVDVSFQTHDDSLAPIVPEGEEFKGEDIEGETILEEPI